MSHVYLPICVILCILLRLHDIELLILPYISRFRLIFGMGSLSDVIESGATVANIIPDESNYCVILYVPEYNISSISVGQDVEYTFNGISVTDFGKVNGKITEISVDSVADNRTGEKYYKVKADLDKFFLKDKKGETRQIKVGMITNAHAITGTQSIFSWLLDKLGL